MSERKSLFYKISRNPSSVQMNNGFLPPFGKKVLKWLAWIFEQSPCRTPFKLLKSTGLMMCLNSYNLLFKLFWLQHDRNPSFFRLDQILGRQGSKSEDVYDSQQSLASRIVKIEHKVSLAKYICCGLPFAICWRGKCFYIVWPKFNVLVLCTAGQCNYLDSCCARNNLVFRRSAKIVIVSK